MQFEGTITKEVAGVTYTASDAAALKGQFANVPATGNTDLLVLTVLRHRLS